MSDPVIKVEGVSKRYRRGQGFGEATRLTQRLDAGLKAPFRRALGRSAPNPQGEEFWAVRDVSLEVAKGEMLGLIGANGAGKSTLLKLLSRITTPTEGRITIHGTVGSMLELGTGFHPELTGRENLFLNGAILGMRRREIFYRYEEIVEFSGIREFMETPVKRYSSGMFVRLAFSVASHLRPDILLVDEVLAVGDAEFQRKCLNKMQEVTSDHGTTIVFVTHNTSWIRKICDRAIFLESGRIEMEGPAPKVVDDYLERVEPVQHGGVSVIGPEVRRVGTSQARLSRVVLVGEEGAPTDRVRFGQDFTVALEFEVERHIEEGVAVLGVSTLDGGRSLTTYSSQGTGEVLRLEPGTVRILATVRATLLPGEYILDAEICDATGASIDSVERVLSFTVLNVPPEGRDDTYPWETVEGTVRPDAEWTVQEPAPLAETRPVIS